MDYLRTKIEFTGFMKKVVENLFTDYIREASKIKNEIFVADFTSLSKTLLSVDDSVFLLEHDITYSEIENLFTNEKYYRAMKELSCKEKQVIFLTIIEEKKAEQVAEMMNTTKDNIWKIKSRAIKRFLENLSKL